jgi:hypothetical protein
MPGGCGLKSGVGRMRRGGRSMLRPYEERGRRRLKSGVGRVRWSGRSLPRRIFDMRRPYEKHGRRDFRLAATLSRRGDGVAGAILAKWD